MKHVNGVQQEQNIEYHVIEWKNSAFHNHHVRKDKDFPGGIGPFSVMRVIGGGAAGQTDGIEHREVSRNGQYTGCGNGEPLGNSGGRDRGFGQDSMLADGIRGYDEVVISSQRAERQEFFIPVQDMSAVREQMQEAAVCIPKKPEAKAKDAGSYEADKALASAFGLQQGNIRNRLKDSAKRLLEICQKQKEKLACVPARGRKRKAADQTSSGTRKASKEEMLAMQSENHYLLNSYNKNGQYSILGK